MAAFNCTVAIPTRELFSGKIYYASVPSVEGNYGVYPGHEMLIAANKNGGILTLNLDEAGNEQKKFLLYEGASQVYNDILTVIGRFGTNVEDIDIDSVKEKADKMRATIAELEKSDDEQDVSELDTSKHRLAWYETQISYIESHR